MELSFDLPNDASILEKVEMLQWTGQMEVLASSQAEILMIDTKKVDSNNLNEEIVDSTQTEGGTNDEEVVESPEFATAGVTELSSKDLLARNLHMDIHSNIQNEISM
eukprot:14443035-Ditylum_brightwellii.AAC.1